MLCALATTGTCQANELVIHYYVDPIYGDDDISAGGVNSFFNPDGIGPECTGAGHTIFGPHSIRETTPGSSNHPLLHSAFPFKTITGAIASINRLTPVGTTTPPLPHTDPATNLTWSYCIIHLLPGWYGRDKGNSQPAPSTTPGVPQNLSLAVATGTNLGNRLVPNGETFPIHLPPRVSLAGTSALNTVIDTGQVGTAIEFGKIVNGVPINGEGTFVDKITFFACGGRLPRDESPRFEPDGRKCAAILLDDAAPCHPTISNCVFLKNAVGVLVNASPNSISPRIQHDETTIINCTFAWNMVGLWNGQIDEPTGSIGVSQLNIINNIFDGSETIDVTGTLPCGSPGPISAIPSWPTFPAAVGPQTTGIFSAFEGVSQQDLRVAVNGTLRDFNAYELVTIAGVAHTNYNQSLAMGLIANTLPITSPRLSSPPSGFAPGVNIAPFTGWPTQNTNPNTTRGVLYITDLICRGSLAGAFPAYGPFGARTGFDLSAHDLRLSPMAQLANAVLINSQGNPNGPVVLNPLVDAGFSGPFPAVMENGQVLQGPPGRLQLNAQSQQEWQHTCWESDCEGYGNPRIHDHPAYSNTGAGPVGSIGIDIGADELGELVVAGYRFGTTGFLRLAQADADNSGPIPIDNSTIVYLGPPSALSPLALPPAPVPQPDYRSINDGGTANAGWFPNYPQPYAAGLQRTWLSGEGPLPDFLSNNSISRPYYAIRAQGSGRTQPFPTIPNLYQGGGTAPYWLVIAISEVGQSYRATAADITPTLLPDIHPWWTEVLPQFIGMDFTTMCPTLALWQDEGACLGDSYPFRVSGVGLYNRDLYRTPLAQDISPPGARLGAAGIYDWLDDTSFIHGTPPAPAVFENWTPAAGRLLIMDFDPWCRGGNLATPSVNRLISLPSTNVTFSANPVDPTSQQFTEAAALRFTVEWSIANTPWQQPAGMPRQKNIQSFHVVIR